jgi:hypothetical protein
LEFCSEGCSTTGKEFPGRINEMIMAGCSFVLKTVRSVKESGRNNKDTANEKRKEVRKKGEKRGKAGDTEGVREGEEHTKSMGQRM